MTPAGDMRNCVGKSLGLMRVPILLLLLVAGCVQDNGGKVPSGTAPKWYDDPGTFWGP